MFDQSGAPFETALARLELAEVLAATGRQAAAAGEARAAFSALGKIGATRDRARAAALLQRLEAVAHARKEESSVLSLTTRELEILRLVAQGLADKEVAATLQLSEHTVHRHIANVLNKLDVPSRTAAVAQAVHHGLL